MQSSPRPPGSTQSAPPTGPANAADPTQCRPEWLPKKKARWTAVGRLSRDVNRLLRHLTQWRVSVAAAGPLWFPELDVSEGEDAVLIRVDLPGVDPADLQVSVTACGVTVTGQRPEALHTTHGFRRYERRFGSFRRFIPLPAGADASGTRAVLTNGVLEIRVPLGVACNMDRASAAVPVQSQRPEIPVAVSGTRSTHPE